MQRPGQENSGDTDHAVRDWMVARPRVRSDLEFSFDQRRGVPVYIVEDIANRGYYQVGLAEYQFLRKLDGTRTVGEVLAVNAQKLGAEAISEKDALTLMRWLVDHDLLETQSANQAQRRYTHGQERKKKKPGAWTQHLLFLKLPAGNPDRFLGALLPWFGWVFSPGFIALAVCLMIYSGYLVATDWNSFRGGIQQVVLPGNWLMLILVFVGLKVFHELAHGISTKRFGGVVPEWGIQLLVFITPLTYVDATASWRFSQRWQRLLVAAAGMYIEFLIAAIAVLIWARTGSGIANTMAYQVVFAATMITLLFNANPLMRFDGYYILSDLLQIPNLGAKGQAVVKWMSKRFLLGMKDMRFPAQARQQPWAISTYGVLALLWRVVVWIGIMIIASLLARGAGIVIVALVISMLLVNGTVQFVKFMRTGSGGPRPRLVPVLSRLGVVFSVIAALMYFVQIRPSASVATVVDFPDKAVVRIELPGFIEGLNCERGQHVEAGAQLAQLRNPEQETRLKTLESDIAISELRARQYLESEQVAAYQAELKGLVALREKRAVMQQLVDSLTVVAPVSGTAIARDMDSLPGRYLRAGEVIFTILPDGPPQLVLSANQDSIQTLDQSGGTTREFRVRFNGRSKTMLAKIERIETRATAAVPHIALASISGGPLAVRQQGAAAQSDRRRGLARQTAGLSDEQSHFAGLTPGENQAATLQLAEARIAAYASLLPVDDDADMVPLREGEWGFARLRGANEYRLGVWAYTNTKEWVIDKWERARSQ